MNWMTILWPMVASVYITLALIYLWIWFRLHERTPYLWFSLNALAVAAISGFELALMETDNLADYQVILRWATIPIGLMIASLTGFVYSFFGTGRAWLAVTVVGLNASAQIANLLTTPPAVRYAIALRREETWGGAWFTVPTIVNGPWNIVELVSVIALIVFILDSSITLWKRDGQRRALIIGGSSVLFLLLARGHAVLVEEGILHTPYLVSFSYLAVLLVMGHELSREVLSAAVLSRRLRESERRMSLAADAANLGMWVWDAEKDEVWMTETGRALFGFEPDKPLNYQVVLERFHPEDRTARDAALRKAMENQGSYRAEYRILLPDGSLRWTASRGSYFEDGQGKGQRLLGVWMDITAQKHADLQLGRQREEIAHLGRVSMMGQLSSALTHELSQPLGAIMRNAAAARLHLQAQQPDFEELRNIVADICDDDQRARDVIDRLRALLKQSQIASTQLDLHELFEDAVALTRAEANARHVTLEVDRGTRLPKVQADRVHIQQVLLNLLLNAMDAVKDAPPEQRRVTLRACGTAAGLVEIAVSDTGHGIAPENIAKIFEPFFTTKEHGMGMGLAISRTIIEAHGGTTWVESKAGQGTSFYFTLQTAKKGLYA